MRNENGERKEKSDYKIYTYKRNPILISKTPEYTFLLIITAIWFIFQNLQALKLVANSLNPWILGIPYSLFVTWLLSALVTVSMFLVARKWGAAFTKRVEEEFGREED